MSSRLVVFAGGVVLGLMSVITAPEAGARPQYIKEFAKKYPNLEEQAKDQKCNVCHFGTKKTNHNDYGLAIKKKFEEAKAGAKKDGKNVKEPEVIAKAYADVETEKSKVEGKTFGDLIKENKLPGTNPEEPKTAE